MGKTQDKVTYADYFPQASFGDKGRDQFLQDFKLQKEIYDQKIFHFLKKDFDYQSIKPKKYFNHQLWTGNEDFKSGPVKYKLLNPSDRLFLDILKRGIITRLDASAQFNRASFNSFLESIPAELHHLIDYVEDPILETDWSNLGVKTASDLIEGTPYHAKIYRPNCDFFPAHEKKVIFSSYIGSDLGRWHTYCELIELGNLDEVHGIISNGFIKEEKNFLTGNYREGFTADLTEVKNLYHDLSQKEWKSLCSL